MTATLALEKPDTIDPLVRVWLIGVAMLIFCMVIVGGATRLTDSGLSITEWQPLLGAIPPLSDADWLIAFEKYKQIPEYKLQNHWMGLEDFKVIYWWEWAHRFLGRIIGIAYAVPLIAFVAAGQIKRRLWLRLAVIFVLGGLQGALGWYMVASGLSERTDVSQYRLAAHLTLAFALFAAVVWTIYGLGIWRRWRPCFAAWGGIALLALLFSQVALGGFVAGLDAGHASDTWPKMQGAFVPDGLWSLSPAWRNIFDNALTVHFLHRLLAYAVFAFALLLALRTRMTSAWLIFAGVCVQMLLGILTVLWAVPLSVALFHQGGALLLVALALWHVHVVTVATARF
jgi:heme a synthase